MDWRQAKRSLLQDKARKEAYQKVDLGFEIGKMITDARIAKNMTQAKLAKLVGTKQPSIARIEKGDALPSLSFLQKIATAFNTQLLPPRLEFLEEIKGMQVENRTSNVNYRHSSLAHLDWNTADTTTLIQVRRHYAHS